MRGNIFTKIFIGFWLVSIAVLGSWMITQDYFESTLQGEHRPPDKPDGPPHRFVLRLIYGLQNAAEERLPRIVAEARDKHGIELYLLDLSGSDLLGRNPPAAVTALADKLHGRKRRVFDRHQGKPLSAHEIYREDMGRLRLVMVYPEAKHKVLGLLGANLWLRLALAIIISGLACYALSRLMTNRLQELRQASRKLASGELDTRIEVRQRGGDETDELARDFNSMAGQLQRRMQAQKQLLSDVSHELRSPIARLRVALALAEEDPQKYRDYLQRIDHETGRLEQLISQLLASQQESPELDKHIDLATLLGQLCADGNFEGERVNKRVVLHGADQQAIIASAGDLLHKCFENIIRNALKHTPADSQVSVTLSATPDSCQVAVEDQGPGVAEDQLERIFDEFYRVDSARSRGDGGHGLGLAIARRVVELHGGSVLAENSANGLRVSVTLPCTQW